MIILRNWEGNKPKSRNNFRREW